MIADPRTGIQVRDTRVFRARQCTRKENPTDFPLMDRGLTVGFLRFGMNAHKPFFICWYSFQNASGIPKGHATLAVVSKGGGAALAGGIQWRAAPSVAGSIQ